MGLDLRPRGQELVPKILLRVQPGDPQGLKPAFLVGLGGTAEAVPFPKPICETSSNPKVRILEPSGRVKPDRGQRCGCWQVAEKSPDRNGSP